MTVASASGPQLAEILRRLRARPASSWGHGDREKAARAAAQQLADLAADAEGRERLPVPDVGVMAIADQLAVLTEDAAAAGVAGAVLDEVISDLATRLAVRGR